MQLCRVIDDGETDGERIALLYTKADYTEKKKKKKGEEEEDVKLRLVLH